MSAVVRSRWESAAGVHLLVMRNLAAEWGKGVYTEPDGDISLGLDVKDAAWIRMTRELNSGTHGEPPDKVREFASTIAKALMGDYECTQSLRVSSLPEWLPRGIALFDGFGKHVDADKSHAALMRLAGIAPHAEHILHVRLEYFKPPAVQPLLGDSSIGFEVYEPSQFEFLRSMPRLRRLDLCGMPSLNTQAIAICSPNIKASALRCLTLQECTISRGVRFQPHDAFKGLTQIGLSGVIGLNPLFIESLSTLPALKDICITACSSFDDQCMEVFMCHHQWRARPGLMLKVGECNNVSDSWLWSIPRVKGHNITLLDLNLLKGMTGGNGAFCNLQSLTLLNLLTVTGLDVARPNDILAFATCFSFLKILHVKGKAIASNDGQIAAAMLKEWAIETTVDIGPDEFAWQPPDDDQKSATSSAQEDLP